MEKKEDKSKNKNNRGLQTMAQLPQYQLDIYYYSHKRENEEKTCFISLTTVELKRWQLMVGDFVLLYVDLKNKNDHVNLSPKKKVAVLGARVWADNTLAKNHFQLSTSAIEIDMGSDYIARDDIQEVQEEEIIREEGLCYRC